MAAKPFSPGCAVVCGILAVALFGALDWMFVPLWCTQLRSSGWPTVQGVVTESRVHTANHSGGDQYSPYIAYRYRVGGEVYQSDRYQALHWSSNARVQSEWVVERFPAGKGVTVYYDPEDPGFALLAPGLDGNVAWGLPLMALFNLLVAGGWAYWIWRLVRRRLVRARYDRWDGETTPLPFACRLLEEPGGWRLRAPEVGGFGAACLAVGFGLFAATFATAVAGCLGAPVWLLGVLVGLLVVAAPAAIVVWWRRRLATGDYDLVGDERANTLRPMVKGGDGPRPVPIAEIVRIRVTSQRERTGSSRNSNEWTNYTVVADWGPSGGGKRKSELATFTNDPWRAKQVARWVAHRIGVPAELDDQGGAA